MHFVALVNVMNFKANGLGMPDTFDELDRALQIVNKKDGVAAYGVENHWGWTFIPFLQGFGGNVFRNPPEDLMPALDTPEAVKPDVHIYTRSKLSWVTLPEGTPAFQSSYKIDEVWSNESKERLRRHHTDQP